MVRADIMHRRFMLETAVEIVLNISESHAANHGVFPCGLCENMCNVVLILISLHITFSFKDNVVHM